MKQADAKFGVPEAAQEPTRTRRTYAPEFKREVVAKCLVPGASVSAVALSHQINANVVRKWLPRRRDPAKPAQTTMLPVTITPASVATNHKPLTPALTQPRPPIELTLNNATVRLPAGFDPAELHSIVQILATLR